MRDRKRQINAVQPKSAARGIRSGPLLFDYHDAEWGVPERDSRALWKN
jgi:DNA-3-methyladenine glycosylase I